MRSAPFHFVLAAAALLGAAFAGSFDARAAEGDCAIPNADADSLDRVQDCMRMGRHVRVGPSVSRGTATMGEGMLTSAGNRGDEPMHRRVRVPASLGGTMPGFFAQ